MTANHEDAAKGIDPKECYILTEKQRRELLDLAARFNSPNNFWCSTALGMLVGLPRADLAAPEQSAGEVAEAVQWAKDKANDERISAKRKKELYQEDCYAAPHIHVAERLETIIQAATRSSQPAEKITFFNFENEMEDVTNRDNGKEVSAFLMKRFPNGLIVTEE